MKSKLGIMASSMLAWALSFPALAQQPSASSTTAHAERLYSLDCGLTQFKDAAVFSDTGEYDGKPIALPTPCFLVKHGAQWLLWDTGNGDKLVARSGGEEAFGGRFTVTRTLESQLAQIGLKPDDITYVAISHLHRDHTGNIPLFPHATFLVADSELKWALGKPTPFGVNLPTVAPLAKIRVKSSDEDEDVFGDGSVRLLKEPGHTPGSRAMMVRLAKGPPVMITGDVFHTRENYAQDRVPVANVNRADYLASMKRLKRIAVNSGARVVVQHDPQDFAGMPKFPAYLQ